MEYKVLSFNIRGHGDIMADLMNRVYFRELDICMAQELSSSLASNLSGREHVRRNVGYKGIFAPVGVSVHRMMAVTWSDRFTFLTDVPLRAPNILPVILRDNDSGRLVGVLTCHINLKDSDEETIMRVLYPNMVYGMSVLRFGVGFCYGRSYPGCDVEIFGGDINQPHPDFVSLADVSRLRGNLGATFRTRSKLMKFMTHLFGYKTDLVPSLNNWTFGFCVLKDMAYFPEIGGRRCFSVSVFDTKFKSFLSWLSARFPDFNRYVTGPTPAILAKLRDDFGWESVRSFPAFNDLYRYFDRSDTISGIDERDYRLTYRLGWCDVLFVPASSRIIETSRGYWPHDCFFRDSDHYFVSKHFAFVPRSGDSRFPILGFQTIYDRLEELSTAPMEDSLDYIVDLFSRPVSY